MECSEIGLRSFTVAFTLLRARLKEAKGDHDGAREDLRAAAAKDPKNSSYVVALAQLAMSQGDVNGEALRILDEAEKNLGPTRELRLARLVYWGAKGGPKAKAEVGKLAEAIEKAPEADKPLLLGELAMTEKRLGEAGLARQHMTELLALPRNTNKLTLLTTLFDWTLEAGQTAEAQKLIDRIMRLENPEFADRIAKNEKIPEKELKGTYWRFAQADYLISGEVSKRNQASREGSAVRPTRWKRAGSTWKRPGSMRRKSRTPGPSGGEAPFSKPRSPNSPSRSTKTRA